MRCGGGRHVGGALIARGREIEAVQEMPTGPEQPGRDRHVQFVDEPRFEVLADRRHAAADLHILSRRCLRRSFHRLAGTARDKVEHGAAFHLDRRAGVMCQHKYRAVVRRVLPPPATPGVIGPGTTNRAEPVASHDPRADAHPKTRRDLVIDAGGAAGLAIDALKRAGRDEPIVQSFTTDAEGFLTSLERAGAVAVERDRKVVHAHTSHCFLPGEGWRSEVCGFYAHDERHGRKSTALDRLGGTVSATTDRDDRTSPRWIVASAAVPVREVAREPPCDPERRIVEPSASSRNRGRGARLCVSSHPPMHWSALLLVEIGRAHV